MTQQTEVLVLGSGPGGYTAAFRAADLGKKVTIVERFPTLGGVCLNVGCIPSKALLHIAKVKEEAVHAKSQGIDLGEPKIDLDKVRAWKESVVNKLTSGLNALAKQRKVTVIQGTGTFKDANTLTITKEDGTTSELQFEQAIIAAGSEPIRLSTLPEDPRIMSSTGALKLEEVPQSLLIIGGGIIGLEMAMVYHALGSKITIVELGDRLIPGADPDLVKPLHKAISDKYEILLNTKVSAVEAKEEGVWATFEGAAAPAKPQRYDRILSAVGRAPNGKKIGAENIGLNVDARGFIQVNNELRTNLPHIFAIGDIIGQPMLAHKATAEAKVAAEVIAGKKHIFAPRCIPSVAYTDPELAWVGLTETEAKTNNIRVEKAVFPWAASGRALTQGASNGATKLLFDPETQRVLGGGIVGAHAGELIAEVALAIEMGCCVEDITLTIHPHPTLSETVLFSAEMFEGTITDLLPPKKKQEEAS
jgi:dihydrolipoamide dehydrogenase